MLVMRLDQESNTAREYPRLPCPGTRDDKNIGQGMRNSCPLFMIQILQSLGLLRDLVGVSWRRCARRDRSRRGCLVRDTLTSFR